MANKNNIDLSGFDFGFSIVDEDELSAVTSVKAEVEAATDTSKAWKAQADEWQAKTNAIHSHVQIGGEIITHLRQDPANKCQHKCGLHYFVYVHISL